MRYTIFLKTAHWVCAYGADAQLELAARAGRQHNLRLDIDRLLEAMVAGLVGYGRFPDQREHAAAAQSFLPDVLHFYEIGTRNRFDHVARRFVGAARSAHMAAIMPGDPQGDLAGELQIALLVASESNLE
jgi:hypothetical protein